MSKLKDAFIDDIHDNDQSPGSPEHNEQRSSEWHKSRRGKVTGSVVGAILGNNPYATRDDVLRGMIRDANGLEREFTGNAATQHGEQWEPVAIDLYRERTGNTVFETGFHVHPEYDWLGASPDGLIEFHDDGRGGLEVKCPFNGVIEGYTLDNHKWYEDQIRLCMEVTGRDWWDFVVYKSPESEGGEDCTITRINRDPEWFDRALPLLRHFYQEFLDIMADPAKQAPYLQDKEIVMEGNDWLELTQCYKKLKAESAEVEAELEKVKKKLIELAKGTGGQTVKGNGVTVFKSERKGSVDYTKVPELDGVDLEPYRKKGSTSWSVR